MEHIRRGLVVGLMFAVAACAASQENDDTASSGDEASSEVIAAGRAVLPLSADVRAAVRDAASRYGRRDISVTHYGAPIFEPGKDGAAYYEVNLAPGWAVVTTGDPIEVVEFNTDGEGPTARLTKSTRGAKKIVRLDTALYIATDDAGKALSQNASSIVKIDRSKGDAEEVATTPDDAIASYTAVKNERDAKKNQAGNATPQWFWNSAAPKKACDARGEVPNYKQLGPNEAPNTKACDSGCGPTAWAMIFGWASRDASSNGADAAFAGLFRSGASASGDIRVAPMSMDGDVGALSMALNDKLNTFCVSGQGATPTWGMNNAQDLVDDIAPGVKINTKSNALMIAEDGIRNAVVDALCDGRPSIVGIGSLFKGNGHYPVAVGYKDGMFNLNMGWGGNGNGWYKASTWFMGNVSK